MAAQYSPLLLSEEQSSESSITEQIDLSIPPGKERSELITSKGELNTHLDEAVSIEQEEDAQSTSSETFNPITDELTLSYAKDSLQNQLLEIEALREKILENSDFDINDLESPAAGNQDGNSVNISSTDKSFSSNAYAEQIAATQVSNQASLPSNNQTLVTNSAAEESPDIPDQSQALPENNIQAAGQVGSVETSVNEDLITSRSGNFNANFNINEGQLESEYGTLSFDSQGNWNYSLNNGAEAVQAISANDQILDSFEVPTISGDHISIEIQIQGTNDTPQISGINNLELQALSNSELGDRPETINGKLEITDRDSGESKFIANDNLDSDYGLASIDETGAWQYILDSEQEAIKNLKEGETLTENIAVLSADGTSKTLNITIHGADDKPILSGQNRAELNLENETSISDSLHINDPDFGESFFIADSKILSLKGYGYGSIDENGDWTFEIKTSNSNLSKLEDGEVVKDFFTVKTADGTVQSVIIEIKNGLAESEAIADKSDLLIDFDDAQESAEQLALDQFLNTSTTISTNTPSSESHQDSAFMTNTIHTVATQSDAMNFDSLIEPQHSSNDVL